MSDFWLGVMLSVAVSVAIGLPLNILHGDWLFLLVNSLLLLWWHVVMRKYYPRLLKMWRHHGIDMDGV